MPDTWEGCLADTDLWTSAPGKVMLVSGRRLAKSLDEAEASATGIIELPADPGCVQLDFNSGRDSSDTFSDLKVLKRAFTWPRMGPTRSFNILVQMFDMQNPIWKLEV